MPTTKFEVSALFEFLGRVDRELAAPCVIFLIGGSAVSIIDPAHSTSDVDLLSCASSLRQLELHPSRCPTSSRTILPLRIWNLQNVLKSPQRAEWKSA